MSGAPNTHPKPVALWARIVGVLALVAAAAMIVWVIVDIVRSAGVSEIVMDFFIAAVFVGIGTTLLGLWKARGGPMDVDVTSPTDD